MRISSRNRLIAGLLLAGAGLTLFFDGFGHVLGDSLGFVGVWLFIPAVWYLVDALHRLERTDAELAIAPGEWQAWVGLAFMTVVLAAMLHNAALFAEPVPISDNPDAGRAGRRIGNLFIAWAILSQVLKARWRGKVQADERDLQISELAGVWGRSATAIWIIGLALLLGFSPTERLASISYPLLAHLLMLALVLGAWFDHLIAALLYWRDRRAVLA
jgi:L-asparagine transporter-like permease